jgi:EAL domain-containing protein (putative c-di-GMP-specific phosphodiesterase class I)
MSLVSSLDQMRSDRALLDEMIEKNTLGAEFQPVVDLASGQAVGYKAIARGPAGTAVASPAGLLRSAVATGLVDRLDWMFRCEAFDQFAAARLPRERRLFVLPEPETYRAPCPPRLAAAFGRARRELSVVIDVAPRAFDDLPALLDSAAEWRSYGWQVAVEDCADQPNALEALPRLAPEIVKVDLALPGRLPGQLSSSVRALLEYAESSFVTVCAESLDLSDRRSAALELGAELGRGRAIAHPGPLPQ